MATLTSIIWRGVASSGPAPLAYLIYPDACRSYRLPALLIPALCNYFGANPCERFDLNGTSHSGWIKQNIL